MAMRRRANSSCTMSTDARSVGSTFWLSSLATIGDEMLYGMLATHMSIGSIERKSNFAKSSRMMVSLDEAISFGKRASSCATMRWSYSTYNVCSNM